MAGKVIDKEIKKMEKAMLDPEDYHVNFEHASDVWRNILRKYGVDTTEQAIAYMKKAIELNFDHVKEQYLEVLIIDEKYTIALEIAKRLSGGPFEKHTTEDGYTTYSFRCTLFGREANVWVVSTMGHVQKKEFADGGSTGETEKLFRARIVNGPRKKKFPAFLEQAARNCHAVVFALDNDNAGEGICFEVLEYTKKYILVPPGGNLMDYVFRVRFSSPTEIVNSLKNLDRLNIFRYAAVEAQRDFDLITGPLFNRAQRSGIKDITGRHVRKMAFGPCLTPCTKLVVDRYLLVKNTPAKYCLEYRISVDGKVLVIHSPPLGIDEANKKCAELQEVKCCRVTDDPKLGESVVVRSPAGLNTFELLESLCKYLNMSPWKAACRGQKLYEVGVFTYPRSESTKYPKGLKIDISQLLDNLSKLGAIDGVTFPPNMRFDVQKVMGLGIDKGDHPPVMPTAKKLTQCDIKRLRDDVELRAVYRFVVRRFLASFMDDYRYHPETITFAIGNHKIDYTYFQHESLGFTQALPEFQVETPSADILAKLTSGVGFEVAVSVQQCPRLSLPKEHEMIRKMEKFKIGTDGSIPNHISSIQVEGYVRLNPTTRELEPTPLGLLMIRGFQESIPEMVEPKYRAKFIQAIEEIASGERDFVTFYNKTLRELYANFLKFQEKFPAFVESVKEELHLIIFAKNHVDMKRRHREDVENLLKKAAIAAKSSD